MLNTSIGVPRYMQAANGAGSGISVSALMGYGDGPDGSGDGDGRGLHVSYRLNVSIHSGDGTGRGNAHGGAESPTLNQKRERMLLLADPQSLDALLINTLVRAQTC